MSIILKQIQTISCDNKSCRNQHAIVNDNDEIPHGWFTVSRRVNDGAGRVGDVVTIERHYCSVSCVSQSLTASEVMQ